MRMRATAETLPVPRRTGRLAVGGGHELAWQEFGARGGLPALVLHGGPGSALTPALVRFFDLRHWRVFGFDQRGCGASTPRGETAANDTAHLLQDIEVLRLHFGVTRWFVVGGSWGATLALAYAAYAPHAVTGLLLRALFVPEPAELRWFFQDAREVAPRAWEQLAGLAPAANRGDLVRWLADVFAHGEPALQARVALAWMAWEHALSRHPRGGGEPGRGDGAQGEEALGSRLRGNDERYRIQSHYLAHGCWLGNGELRDAARRVTGIPVRFLHGEEDVVCRPAAAQSVQRLMRGSSFERVPQAGHDPMHPAMVAAMERALASSCAEAGREPA